MSPEYRREELLIITKTYPQPSAKYRETSCVAAINGDGQLRRLFPIPFRLLEGEHQFKRWEWVGANIVKATGDNRPESHKVDVDSIERLHCLGTERGWAERRSWLAPHIIESFDALEARRQESGQTIGVLRPSRLVRLEVTPLKERFWTEEEWSKLTQEQLFDSNAVRNRPPLEKIPYNFHYVYEFSTPAGLVEHRHMITDWEAGALYRRCVRDHGPSWEKYFRMKLEEDFAEKDLMLLMGTMHRLPDHWLVIGLIYPPRLKDESDGAQLSLGF